mgnify:CR=1 FL=1|tara:strand:- start:1585 stop:1848 length:264 start_codon:yes stop_codon:yes gene_type:complete
MPSYSFDDGAVSTSYTSTLDDYTKSIAYSTLLTSASYVWPGFDSLYDMDTGLYNERDWKEWEDWGILKWKETDPSVVGYGLKWKDFD